MGNNGTKSAAKPRAEHDRVDVLQRPLGPLTDVVHDRVGHAADQVEADLDAVDLGQVRPDVTDRQPAAVERQDLVVEPDEPPLALADDLRLKAAVTVARRVDLDLPVLADQRLRGRAVALRELLADRTDAHVTVDVDPDALERAADAWGPPPPQSTRMPPLTQGHSVPRT